MYDSENGMPPQMLTLIQEILLVRCDSDNEENLRSYLNDLEDPVYSNIPEFRRDIYPILRTSILKVQITLLSCIFRE